MRVELPDWVAAYAERLHVDPLSIAPLRHTAIGGYVWPIEEFIARKKCKPRVAARLRRLNPNGVEGGSFPRGYHPHARTRVFSLDCESRAELVRRRGRAWVSARRHLLEKVPGCGKRVRYSYFSMLEAELQDVR
jgi:hypothetical protein